MAIEALGTVERVQHLRVRTANNVELFAIVLAREERDVAACEPAAKRLAERYPGTRVLDIGHIDLRDASGLEPFEVLQRLAAMELGRRAQAAGTGDRTLIDNHEAAYRLFLDLIGGEKQEVFCAALLDSKNYVISTERIHIGTVNMSVVGPREVFRPAVRENAAAIVVAHNHPSGDPSPSPEDVAVTRRLAEVGKLLDIKLLDHVIVGDNGRFTSFQKEGML